MTEVTILYLTDNCLDPTLAALCQKYLLKAANGKRIVSVSQRPLNFGDNICVGEIGRSGLSIERQLEVGLKAVQTRFVALAEHDCIYPAEHFDFVPLNDEDFFYNTNNWFLHVRPNRPDRNGLFSFIPNRYAQSQLLANTDRMREATARKMVLLLDPAMRQRAPIHSRICEPGVDRLHPSWKIRHQQIYQKAIGHLRQLAYDYITSYIAKAFQTSIPSIDIRHYANFTGFRMGHNRRRSLEPWGTMEDILRGPA